MNLEFHERTVTDLDTGKVFELSCTWRPEYAGLTIPEFCRISDQDRTIARLAYVPPITPETIEREAWKVQQDELRSRIADAQKKKDLDSIARLKDKHAGERYDKKTKKWVTVAVTENEHGIG